MEQLGKTSVTSHVIDTGDASPVRGPPHPILFHYAVTVHRQLNEMASNGNIRPSSSPQCAPALYVPKSNGELRICVDFAQLNHVSEKNSYPIPIIEVYLQVNMCFPNLIYTVHIGGSQFRNSLLRKLYSALDQDMDSGNLWSCPMA